MAMRNFWLEANIDGRKTPLCGGPRAKIGGFNQKIYIRNDGCSEVALTIVGEPVGDGRLRITVLGHGENVEMLKTKKISPGQAEMMIVSAR